MSKLGQGKTLALAGRMVAIASLPTLAAPLAAGESEQILVVKDQYPSISPDGKRMVFESNRAGEHHQIFLMDLETRDIVQLTHDFMPSETPVWSPDGEHILFAHKVADEPRPTWEIFRMNADGSSPVNLTGTPGHDGHHHYSADGQSIIFNSTRVTDMTGLTEEQLDNGGYNYEVYRMDADGGNVTRLTDYFEWDTYPSLSPDGSTLVWRRILPEGGSGPSGMNSEIYMADADGRNPRNITNNAAFDGYPLFSPDGSKLAFASNRDGKAPLEFNIYIMDVSTRVITRVTETIDGTEQVRPSWFPDGRKIVYNLEHPDGRSEIHVMELPKELHGGTSER